MTELKAYTSSGLLQLLLSFMLLLRPLVLLLLLLSSCSYNTSDEKFEFSAGTCPNFENGFVVVIVVIIVVAASPKKQ